MEILRTAHTRRFVAKFVLLAGIGVNAGRQLTRPRLTPVG